MKSTTDYFVSQYKTKHELIGEKVSVQIPNNSFFKKHLKHILAVYEVFELKGLFF